MVARAPLPSRLVWPSSSSPSRATKAKAKQLTPDAVAQSRQTAGPSRRARWCVSCLGFPAEKRGNSWEGMWRLHGQVNGRPPVYTRNNNTLCQKENKSINLLIDTTVRSLRPFDFVTVKYYTCIQNKQNPESWGTGCLVEIRPSWALLLSSCSHVTYLSHCAKFTQLHGGWETMPLWAQCVCNLPIVYQSLI